eukprot:291510-Amphidinium_carterae.1
MFYTFSVYCCLGHGWSVIAKENRAKAVVNTLVQNRSKADQVIESLDKLSRIVKTHKLDAASRLQNDRARPKLLQKVLYASRSVFERTGFALHFVAVPFVVAVVVAAVVDKTWKGVGFNGVDMLSPSVFTL